VVPSLLTGRSFLVGLFTSASFSMAFTGYLFEWTLLLQQGMGLNTVQAAIASTPFALGVALSAIVLSRRLLPMLGAYLVCIGAVFMAGGLWLTIAGLEAFPHHIKLGTALPQLLSGLGMGCVGAPTTNLVLKQVNVAFAGSASGVLSAVQQFSGAIGIALAGAVFFPLVVGTPTQAHFIHGFAGALIAQSILLTITFAGGLTLARETKLPKPLTA
jgi:hypothetical protein